MMSKEPYKLENSRFWRDWCIFCGEPIRVNESDVGKGNQCDGCRGRKPPSVRDVITPRQRAKLDKTTGG